MFQVLELHNVFSHLSQACTVWRLCTNVITIRTNECKNWIVTHGMENVQKICTCFGNEDRLCRTACGPVWEDPTLLLRLCRIITKFAMNIIPLKDTYSSSGAIRTSEVSLCTEIGLSNNTVFDYDVECCQYHERVAYLCSIRATSLSRLLSCLSVAIFPSPISEETQVSTHFSETYTGLRMLSTASRPSTVPCCHTCNTVATTSQLYAYLHGIPGRKACLPHSIRWNTPHPIYRRRKQSHYPDRNVVVTEYCILITNQSVITVSDTETY